MIWSELPANLVILGEANLDFMIVKARKTNEKKNLRIWLYWK